MRDIKNIVFDLGGVIVDLDIEASIVEFARLGLRPQGLTLEELSRNGIPKDWEMRRLMHAMDIGDMQPGEFIGIVKAQCLPGTTDDDILRAFNRIIVLPRQRLEWLVKLRQRYNVFLLSNIGEIHWGETQRQAAALGIPIEGCFHRLFLSYQLRMVKPDPRIFSHLIETTGIRPQETLYIDDLPDNIEAGNHAGLVGHKIDCNSLNEEFPKLFPELI